MKFRTLFDANGDFFDTTHFPLSLSAVQDLNPCDFEFIHELIQRGVNVFICGDDDQSVYSFRYAFPAGIQNFTVRYPGSTSHNLNDCFRCTTSVLGAAQNVIANNIVANRIQKNLTSVYAASNPANPGFTEGYIFNNATTEARFIARSCLDLIQAGVSPDDIMILVGNRPVLLNPIIAELDRIVVPYDANIRDEFKDTSHGRFVISLLRILANNNDYVAHRVLLGVRRGVGLATCNSITQKVIANGINYRSLFYNPLPNAVFSNRETSAINNTISNVAAINGWTLNDTLQQRNASLTQLVLGNFTQNQVNDWNTIVASVPNGITLEEFKDYLESDSQQTKDNIISGVLARTNQAGNNVNPPQAKIKIMSFHSSKGLSAKIVFIPGLEETVFPNNFTRQAPGLLLEAARLFYVAITRAKTVCILSYSRRRTMQGVFSVMTASRFCAHTGIQFSNQPNNSLTAIQIQDIQVAIRNL